jgi:hypothetical protein
MFNTSSSAWAARGWMCPKGMDQATRDRVVAIIMKCEERRDNALAAFVARHFPGGFKSW